MCFIMSNLYESTSRKVEGSGGFKSEHTDWFALGMSIFRVTEPNCKHVWHALCKSMLLLKLQNGCAP